MDAINEWTLKATYSENYPEKNKHNAKPNENLEVNIESSFSKQIKFLPQVSKTNSFIVANKYLIATNSCFVPVTLIRDEVGIKGNVMQWSSGKEILQSLPKDDIKHFLNQCYIV